MKRNDIIILVILVGLLLALPYLDKVFFRKVFPASPGVTSVARTNAPDASAKSADLEPELASEVEAPDAAETAPAVEEQGDDLPEQLTTLKNERLQVTVSSKGAAIVDATLFNYRAALDEGSPPVVLNFADRPALAYADLPGFGGRATFAVDVDADGKSARLERTAGGLKLVRTIALGATYTLDIQDELVNTGGEAISLAPYSMTLGIMTNLEPQHGQSMWVTLGVDTLAPGGEGVKHWGDRIAKLFTRETEDRELPKLPMTIDRSPVDGSIPATWVATKNKYFAQILTPEDGGDAFKIWARRSLDPREVGNPEYRPKMTPLDAVSASITYPDYRLAAGEAFSRKMQFYIGPKKYSELHASKLHHVDVMEFGIWAPIGKILLQVMNFIYAYIPNYGVAIMLLTVIIRILFWPITRKSTQSMKKMAALQPMIKELQERHKANPQKMQQEMMALYRENKVNPLSGCLPLLIQIPVFIALFVVLRSAIELRFASFLWIHDLSEPENLFADVLPFPLNTLPLLMAATMFLQMKLTPSAGDPAQQKIMMIMMPAMMLFFLYSYPAGLALYWTTQNILMIIQQLMNQRDVKLHPQPVAAK
jgi:YidC/Oxa1 family membrane protein insertase